MNRVFIVGNITGDIYYDRHLIKGQERSYLRLILMTSRPRIVQGMRIVLWDQNADLYYPYLQKGSEIAVIGQLQSRVYREKNVHEIEAEQMILLRKIDWSGGERSRQKNNLAYPAGNKSSVFVVGEVTEDIYFDYFKRSPEKGGGEYAFLRLILNSDEYLNGLRVILRGTLAELAFPYLQPGSKVAIDGHIQTRDRENGQRVTEITAEHIAFLENIHWEAGEQARQARAVRQLATVEEVIVSPEELQREQQV